MRVPPTCLLCFNLHMSLEINFLPYNSIVFQAYLDFSRNPGSFWGRIYEKPRARQYLSHGMETKLIHIISSETHRVGQTRFIVVSRRTQSLFLNYYLFYFHMNKCKPTFAPPCIFTWWAYDTLFALIELLAYGQVCRTPGTMETPDPSGTKQSRPAKGPDKSSSNDMQCTVQ